LTKVLYVGPSSISSAGLSDESIVYVVCECEGEISTKGNEASEEISVEAISDKKLDQWLEFILCLLCMQEKMCQDLNS
jgi:hypothetical protein